MNFPYLSVLTGLPLLGSVVVALLPRRRTGLARIVTLLWTLAVLGLAIATWVAFRVGGDRFQLRESYPWIPNWDARFTFAVDGIALVMIALVAFLIPIVVIYSWPDSPAGTHHEAQTNAQTNAQTDAQTDAQTNAQTDAQSQTPTKTPTERETGAPAKRSVHAYLSLLLALESTMIGVFAAADVFLFVAFFEIMLVPMYFLIGSFGGARRQYAAVKFFLYSLVGGLFMLAAVIGLWVLGGHTFDWEALRSASFTPTAERWLFLGFFVAFAIKAPFFPFHTWLPDAGGAASAGTGALLVGVLDKVGTFGILRYCLPLFPNASRYFAPLGLTLALIGIIYAALLAVGQNDLKRLVAYASVAHFGFIGIGIFALNSQAGSGAVLYMVNHGLATGLLFLAIGMLISRRGSALVGDFGGAGRTLPVLAGVFLIAGLASLALPGTAPFVSEFLVLLGTYRTNRAVAVVGTLGIILAACYILWMVQRTAHGRPNPALAEIPAMRRDLTWRESIVVVPLVGLLIFFGFYPKPLLDVINPAVAATLSEQAGVTGPMPGPVTGPGMAAQEATE